MAVLAVALAACSLIVTMLDLINARLARLAVPRSKAEQELAHANRLLEQLAMQDCLTAIPNRRRFDDAYAQAFSQARRHSRFLAVIMLDIDYFKQYNDRYGHVAGDECLKRVAQAISAVAGKRPGDLVARYGGEEFVALLPETDLHGAMVAAERMRAAVEALQIPHADGVCGIVTVSVGINACEPLRESGERILLATADEALYQAKRSGRNCVRGILPWMGSDGIVERPQTILSGS